ncbi:MULTISPECIES: response regulator [Brucella/Ochrobactrum group]|jgi:DNA-binding NtrC family response regulator|uniref:Response regulator n=1 Tax=Brucella pseudintermedia TaxID=370111 RepID=A0ABY5UBR2_9HYPH|nr:MULTISPECIES: response regulator [Brucella/Ochrobactrum group]KAB2682699.1 response regulator [Brucella pseudintermedia]MCO7725169.1 response regulator [Brucella intermedia]NKE76051.1 response regulator [Ochrobactrum sp. MC-1LL]TWH00378.1 Response regulator containing CheY-like receiver, AAA-type ATPase, and DNA-binding domains [Ochrobactrum sp. J50]UWL59822.1 response regulator [Brucella pseudintermedia]
MNDLGHRRVLVVEDEVFVALDVAATVEDANGTVLGPVGTVRQAIDIINRNEIDAAILDVNLADGDVEAVLDRLKSRDVFVVIHTGGGLPARLADRYPEVPVFQKPIPPSVLTRTLASALASHLV